MLNSSVHTASTALKTTGRYSGRHPAMTALIATFSTVAGARLGGTVATTSSGSRDVPWSMASTRVSVGGTTGSPSVQPRSHMASISSSISARCTRRDCSSPARNAHFQALGYPRVEVPGAAARLVIRQAGPEAGHAGERFPSRSVPADQALFLHTTFHAQQGRHRT